MPKQNEMHQYAAMTIEAAEILERAEHEVLAELQKTHGEATVNLALFVLETALMMEATKIALRRKELDPSAEITAKNFGDVAANHFRELARLAKP